MANPIKHDQLIEDNVFKPTIDGGNTLIDILGQINAQLKQLIVNAGAAAKSNPLKSYSDVENITVAYQETKKATDELAKSELQLAKAIEINNKAQAGEIDVVVKNKEETKALNAETRLRAKAHSDAAGAYAKESAMLKVLIAKYKNLAIEGKANDRVGKALLRDIQARDKNLKKLDATVGQHQRNVGNYMSALEGLPGPLGKAAEGTQAFGMQLLQLLKNPVVAIIAAIVVGINLLIKAFKSTDEGSGKFAEMLRTISDIASVLIQRLGAFANGVVNLFKGNWAMAANNFEAAFTGIAEQIRDAAQAAVEYERALDKIGDAETNLISERSKNAREIAKLEFDAADPSKTIAQREKALDAAIKLSEKQLAQEKKIADDKFKAEVEHAAKLHKIDVELLKAFIDADDEKAQAMLKNNSELARARNELNDEGQASLEEFYNKATDLETAFFNEEKKNNARRANFRKEIQEDEFRRAIELEKLQIELMDEGLQKQLALENLRYKQEQHDLAENQKALEVAREVHNKKVLEIIRANSYARLAAEKQVQKLVLEANAREFDLRLKQIQDQAEKELEEVAKLFREKLIAEGKFYQAVDAILKKRATAEEKARKDKVEKERADQIEAVHLEEQRQEALLEQQRVNFKNEKDWEIYKQKELIKIKREAIEAELQLLKDVQGREAETRREQLKAELVSLDFELDKINQQILQRQAQKLEQLAKFTDEQLEKQSQKRLTAIDKEVEASKKRQDELRELAIKGNKTAEQSIAEEEKRQAELQLKREKELAKAKRRELGLAAINTYTAKVQAGDKNALGSTIRDLVLLGQAIQSIPGFIEGTESVEDDLGKPHLPGRDGYVVRVDGKERILNPNQNMRIGQLSNEELTRIAEQYNSGFLTNASRMPVFGVPTDTESVRVLNKLSDRLEEISANTAFRQLFYYDEVKNSLVEELKTMNRTERTHHKVRRLW